MGYELRRKLRVALGPEITGLQRAVALEIADDANDGTRLSWAALEDLALWTAAKDTNVIRNALKRLAAAGWEFRVPLGVGKDGRTLYAVPGKKLTFRVPDFEGVALATPADSKGEPPLPIGVAPAPSEGATAPCEGAPATPFSSSPHDSSSLPSSGGRPREARPEPERETVASPKNPTAAQRALRSSGLLTPDEEQPFIVWATAKFNIQTPGWWVKCTPDLHEHVDAWRSTLVVHERRPSLPPWCGTCADGWTAARLNPRLRTVEKDGKTKPCPDCHPDAITAA